MASRVRSVSCLSIPSNETRRLTHGNSWAKIRPGSLAVGDTHVIKPLPTCLGPVRRAECEKNHLGFGFVAELHFYTVITSTGHRLRATTTASGGLPTLRPSGA